MLIRRTNHVAAIASLSLFMMLPGAQTACAQDGDVNSQLVGTWTAVVVDNVLADGSRVHLYGPHPLGILTFDAKGRYTLQIYRAERAKFASGDKSKATPEENSAAVLGSNAHFGQYTVSAADRSITFHIEHASFPNWDGTEQRRSFAISNDLLTYTVPTPTSGGSAIGEVVWKRAQ